MQDTILVTRSSMPQMDEYVDEIRELWDTHWLTNMGVKHKQCAGCPRRDGARRGIETELQ